MRALEGALQRARVGEIRLEERLANYTTMGVGGPCSALVRPPDMGSLERLIRALGVLEMPYLPIGGGSNLLVSDEGFKGVVIVTDALQDWEELDDHLLRVGAGVNTVKIVKWAACENLTGMEGLAGIPGTIGGACLMNAGGHRGEIRESLQRVEVITSPPEVHTVTVEAEALNLAYRSASLPPGSVLAVVELKLEEDAVAGSVEKMVSEVMEQRLASQPRGVWSAGSIFKNPEDEAAGRLIDRCGLKGMREGRAEVSEIHANFIVNSGGATASQIRALIERVREKVLERAGIELDLEIDMIGFPQDPPPRMAWIPEQSPRHLTGEPLIRSSQAGPRGWKP